MKVIAEQMTAAPTNVDSRTGESSAGNSSFEAAAEQALGTSIPNTGHIIQWTTCCVQN
jgi:hypothetical protein